MAEFCNPIIIIKCNNWEKWVLDLDFRWQEVGFLIKKTLLNREIHAFSFIKKTRVKQGTMLIETVLSRDYL